MFNVTLFASGHLQNFSALDDGIMALHFGSFILDSRQLHHQAGSAAMPHDTRVIP